jgi:hypothetical protein
MRSIDLESWVLRVLDQVARSAHSEDSLVELKATWPKPAIAARQIAAQANAARGAPILWLIGVDESQGVSGASPTELANWFSAVSSHFDHVYPQLQDLNVRFREHTVVALLFRERLAVPCAVKPSSWRRSRRPAIRRQVSASSAAAALRCGCSGGWAAVPERRANRPRDRVR